MTAVSLSEAVQALRGLLAEIEQAAKQKEAPIAVEALLESEEAMRAKRIVERAEAMR